MGPCSDWYGDLLLTKETNLVSFEGCAASFIVMLFPPTSGKKAVRLRNASIVREISSVYSFLLSEWVSETGNGDLGSLKMSKSSTTLELNPKWTEAYRKRLIGLSGQIQALRQMTAIAKWESGLRGRWPIEDYNSLVQTESQMLGSLAQVYLFLQYKGFVKLIEFSLEQH